MSREPLKTISKDLEVLEAAWDNKFNGRSSPAYEIQKELEKPTKSDDEILVEQEYDDYPRK